jgi:hypothetical protein
MLHAVYGFYIFYISLNFRKLLKAGLANMLWNHNLSKKPEKIKKLRQTALKVKKTANAWVNLFDGICFLCFFLNRSHASVKQISAAW